MNRCAVSAMRPCRRAGAGCPWCRPRSRVRRCGAAGGRLGAVLRGWLDRKCRPRAAGRRRAGPDHRPRAAVRRRVVARRGRRSVVGRRHRGAGQRVDRERGPGTAVRRLVGPRDRPRVGVRRCWWRGQRQQSAARIRWRSTGWGERRSGGLLLLLRAFHRGTWTEIMISPRLVIAPATVEHPAHHLRTSQDASGYVDFACVSKVSSGVCPANTERGRHETVDSAWQVQVNKAIHR